MLAIIISLSNVVFPNNSPDSSPGMLFVAFLIGEYIIWSSYHANSRIKKKNIALKIGVFTSLIGFIFAMLTFAVIDNIFLNIVSQQADKVLNFHNGHYSSMRVMINLGLIRGVLFGLPASMIFGLICGFIGSSLSKIKIIIATIALGGVLVVLLIISQIRYLQKAHSTFENYYAFRGCVQLINRTQEYGTCKISTGKTIKIVKFQKKWYLDGDLPCGFLCF